MTIYIDVLLCINLIIDYFLLSLTIFLLKTKVKFIRQIAGAFFGALSSIIIVVNINAIICALLHLIFAAITVLITFGFKTIKNFIKAILVFYIVSFLFSGIMKAVLVFIAPTGFLVKNGVVYYNLSSLMLIGLSVFIYLIINLILRFIKSRNAPICQISINGIILNTLIDSGNHLIEPFSKKYVMLIDNKYKGLITAISGTERVIPYSTIDKQGMLMGFLTKDNIIINSTKANLDVYLAFSKTRLNKFDAIISKEAVEGGFI